MADQPSKTGMSHGRIMGFAWGMLAGGCIACGFTYPAMFLVAIVPIAGNYLHRHSQ